MAVLTMNTEKVLLVTGGSRGIGAAIAEAAAGKYCVCISYVTDEAAGNAVVAKLREAGSHAMAVQADVSREADVLNLFKSIDKEFGRIDALVNNAGMLTAQQRVSDMTAERIRRIFDVNVVGSFLCSREAVKRMSTRYGGRGGAIVNVSSRAAKLGSPGEYVDYAASKAAVETLTIGLAKEVAKEGIRVNTVSPGSVYTDIHASGGEPGRVDRVSAFIPMGRGGHPGEVAKAVLWMLSDDASYSTGSKLDVSGGL